MTARSYRSPASGRGRRRGLAPVSRVGLESELGPATRASPCARRPGEAPPCLSLDPSSVVRRGPLGAGGGGVGALWGVRLLAGALHAAAPVPAEGSASDPIILRGCRRPFEGVVLVEVVDHLHRRAPHRRRQGTRPCSPSYLAVGRGPARGGIPRRRSTCPTISRPPAAKRAADVDADDDVVVARRACRSTSSRRCSPPAPRSAPAEHLRHLGDPVHGQVTPARSAPPTGTGEIAPGEGADTDSAER